MINMFLAVVGAIVFLIGIYALIKLLTKARERLLEMVDGDILAFVSMIAFMLVVIGGSAWWIFSSLDFDAARNFRRYVHTFPETYFIEGTLCLLLTYGFAKINPDKLNGRVRMSGGKRSFVIVFGIVFGVLAVLLGLKKLI